MFDINHIIAYNIRKILKSIGKTQNELANEMGCSKQIIIDMLSGAQTISTGELSRIANICQVSTKALIALPEEPIETDAVRTFINNAKTIECRKGMEIADKLIDMYLFHSHIRECCIAGSTEWSSL